MGRKVFSLILYLTVLCPFVASAQFFEKQKVVVWEIFDRNNDVKVSSAAKQMMRTGFVDAFVSSRSYEAFEVNIDDVKNYIKSKGWSVSPQNIAVAIRNMHKVDYVLFTTLKVLQHGASYDTYNMLLTSELFSTETQKTERTSYQELKSDINEIPVACATLLGKLLGEQIKVVSSPVQGSQPPSAGRQYNPPAYNVGPQDYVESTLGLNMKMVYVEGGQFQMGATSEQSGAESDESPVHSVTLDSYYISATEVTQAQWQAVMGTTIHQQASKAGYSVKSVGSDYPMYYVSWEEARAFCSELSALTGKTYLLPTEAQWEYAARGGKKSRSSQYSGSYSVDAVAWYYSNSGGSQHPVGKLRANELGLYDMSGNVWEWCMDWKGSYSSNAQFNPTGPSSGSDRVLRGGSLYHREGYCRVAFRFSNSPSSRFVNLGFRVVCLP